jgi:nitrile hydratase
VVTRVCGPYVLPDTNAHLRGESPEHVYTVRFAGSDLWGDRAEANSVVYVDAWESYLEPVTTREEAIHGRA